MLSISTWPSGRGTEPGLDCSRLGHLPHHGLTAGQLGNVTVGAAFVHGGRAWRSSAGSNGAKRMWAPRWEHQCGPSFVTPTQAAEDILGRYCALCERVPSRAIGHLGSRGRGSEPCSPTHDRTGCACPGSTPAGSPGPSTTQGCTRPHRV